MTTFLFCLAGGIIGISGVWTFYSYVFPLITGRLILAAFMETLD